MSHMRATRGAWELVVHVGTARRATEGEVRLSGEWFRGSEIRTHLDESWWDPHEGVPLGLCGTDSPD